MRRPVVGIFPAAKRQQCRSLFDVLEDALEVRLPAREIGEWAGLDGAILVTSDPDTRRRVQAAIPRLLIAEDRLPMRAAASGIVHFRDDSSLPECLRGTSLGHEGAMAMEPLMVVGEDRILAATDRGPVWIRRAGRAGSGVSDCIACAPAELDPDESLRAGLQANYFLPLLPLVHFLRTVSPDLAWELPPLRATFLFDDPNLHCGSYGYIDFASLATHAKHNHYHAACAMVPLDAWYASAPAVRLFHQHSGHLSLLFHGNNHTFRELERPTTEEAALPIIAQALRRITHFERETGLTVSRVMVAPHNACSNSSICAMASLGFEALCSTRSHLSLVEPGHKRRWAACAPAITTASGFPIISRAGIKSPLGELVMRAFLGQPLILYGHHRDLAGGMGVLADAAQMINAWRSVRWCSLEEIARTNFAQQREGSHLRIRAYTQHLRLVLPEGVDSVSVALLAGGNSEIWRARCGPADSTWRSANSESDGVCAFGAPLGESLELMRRRARSVDLETVPDPAWRPAPVLRRIASEARDRLVPLLRASAKP